MPSCLKGMTFLATAVQAVPYVALLGENIINLPKWSGSLNVFQVTPNGSFSPELTVIGDGPEHASTTIPVATLYTDEQQRRRPSARRVGDGEHPFCRPRDRLLRDAVRDRPLDEVRRPRI